MVQTHFPQKFRTSLVPPTHSPQGFSAVVVLSSPPPLLDLFPGAAAAYSMRLLRTLYTGDAIRVQRSSDSTELDIGFLNGGLDVAALLSFVGSSDGLVVTIYDQSGNGRDMDGQTDITQVPRIVIAGVLQLSNNMEGAEFDGINDVQFSTTPALSSPADQLFVFTTYAKNDLTDSGVVFNLNFGSTASTRCFVQGPQSDGNIQWDPGVFLNNRLEVIVTNDRQQHILTVTKIAEIDNQVIRRDGIQVAQRTQSASFPTTVVEDIGLGAGDNRPSIFNPFDIIWQELVVYDTDELNKVPGIENNTINYWTLGLLITNAEDSLITNEGDNLVFI